MKAEILGFNGSWKDVKNACRSTVGKEHTKSEPSDNWKTKVLYSEHSPIRLIRVHWIWKDLPYWISVHFTRHKIGIEHFVRTQRTDRTGIDRDILGQGELVTHECVANLQAIINISRKRLCKQASPETRKAWEEFLKEVVDHVPELYVACVPECVYRGFCPEFFSCKWVETEDFKKERNIYSNFL